MTPEEQEHKDWCIGGTKGPCNCKEPMKVDPIDSLPDALPSCAEMSCEDCNRRYAGALLRIAALEGAIREHRDNFPDEPLEGELKLWALLPD